MIENLDRIIDLIEIEWPKKHVLVIGDVMLDRYIWGDVTRISPEAPVPVVRASHNSEQPGGAANVAMNLAGLGAKVTVIGFAGEDADRTRLAQMLGDSGATPVLVPVPGLPTISKLRILSGSQQMLRVDTESKGAIDEGAYAELKKRIKEAMAGCSAVILSDYAKGVLTEEVCQTAIEAARQCDVPVLVDPKTSDFRRYRGATTVCPNLGELRAAVRDPSGTLEQLLNAGERLIEEAELAFLTVTLSEKGIAVLRPGSRFLAPAVARQVFDVSGAGDTVISVLALCIGCGLPIESAVQLANIAAGIVVSKVGTVPIFKYELVEALSPDIAVTPEEKLLPLDRLSGRVAGWRSNGERIVLTNGVFDLLHLGHIHVLEEARKQGDRLVVAINGDASTKRLKGEGRPIVSEMERAQILAALAAVDAVVVFDDDTPHRVLSAIRPDILVKGGDYTEETVVGAVEVQSWGGRVKIVPRLPSLSTTERIKRHLSPEGR
jgi:D-beta-D-heptose 7-phosphate kinase/D-beta-D-heptose 1-phosphate adenosyltransferase